MQQPSTPNHAMRSGLIRLTSLLIACVDVPQVYRSLGVQPELGLNCRSCANRRCHFGTDRPPHRAKARMTDWRETPTASAKPATVSPNSGKKSSRTSRPGVSADVSSLMYLEYSSITSRLSESRISQHRKRRRRQSGSRFATVSLTEMECCPFRSPSSAWSRLPGGTFRSSNRVARSTYSSLRARTFGNFRRKPLDLSRGYTGPACAGRQTT